LIVRTLPQAVKPIILQRLLAGPCANDRSMPDQDLVSIAVVDSCPAMCLGICQMLEGIGGYRIALCAGSGEAYLQACAEQDVPQLAIVDLQMPGMDGFVIIAALRERGMRTWALATTWETNDELVTRAYTVGARGLLTKRFSPGLLAGALDNIRTSGYHYGDHTHRKLARAATATTNKKADGALRLASLTDTELAVLKRILNGAKTYDEVAVDMHLSKYTVADHMKEVRRKTGCHSRAELMVFAHENGLLDN
jgi:DNA-binding NarL/FixJ family response regulator